MPAMPPPFPRKDDRIVKGESLVLDIILGFVFLFGTMGMLAYFSYLMFTGQ